MPSYLIQFLLLKEERIALQDRVESADMHFHALHYRIFFITLLVIHNFTMTFSAV
jgi:hypothetical protein